MIQYLKRNQLDDEKYNTCIKNSFNSRVYAYTWYLDCVADNWDALVLNDYNAVMPLPWRRKYFIKYIYPPAWTQQLGVFSSNNISEELVLKFIKAIPSKFKKITIQFNSENKFQYKNLTERINYILPLRKNYEAIYRGFNSNRKRDLKKAIISNSKVVKDINNHTFLTAFFEIKKNYMLSKGQKIALEKLLFKKRNELSIIGVFEEEELIAGLLYLNDTKRITYLLPIATVAAKAIGIPTLLINYLLKKHQESNLIFDFEGSMINGVADFYKSFGVEKEFYSNFKRICIGK